jgi:hypothetical protein
MFRSLPNDVLFVIRSFLIVLGITHEPVDEIHQFLRQDSERSWRNFLYASNSEYWKSIRKETMIWSLNGMAFKKYLTNTEFRRFINQRMSVPVKQLFCKTYLVTKDLTMNNLMIDAVRTSSLCSIHIQNFRAREFPSSERLQFLNLELCYSLKRLGEYPHLTILQLTDCPRLKKIMKMGNLVELRLCDVNKRIIPQFPFEQLSTLQILKVREKDILDQISHRIKSVKELVLTCGGSFTAEMCPDIVKLHLSGFSSIALVGLTELSHLIISYTPANRIFGDEHIYSRLKSFSYSSGTECWESVDYLPEQLTRAEELNLELFPCKTSVDSITIPDKVRSFCLYLPVSNIYHCHFRSRPFYQVSLTVCSITDFSAFVNVQILSLERCPNVVDVSPFQNVPHLTLSNLPSVKNFSSLGKQKYLSICRCDGLSNKVVSGFGDVFRLSIRGCFGVTQVTGLEKNKYLLLSNCPMLGRVVLQGKDYFQVSIRACYLFEKLIVTGSVYSVEIRRCGEPYQGRTELRNCEYLNGKWVGRTPKPHLSK